MCARAERRCPCMRPLRAHLAVMCAVQVDLGETFGVGPGGLHRSDFEKMILTTPRGLCEPFGPTRSVSVCAIIYVYGVRSVPMMGRWR